ncbi:DUF2019 domain-containing protein [Aurantimonas marina]|uniref:DUF2019 domain-containing protein n=1 Tax=Aurantimonas marina TaxID=2780508 RepID=UPI0019D29935|nr:DUF2019 domain-containing protein [Aurantimonas marina]
MATIRPNLTVPELIEAFIAVGLAQSKAIDDDNHQRYNNLVDDYLALEAELRSRQGDERRALLPLFDHMNVQVRMNAALSTLALLPDEARETLRLIHARREYPQAADAISMLNALERGTYVPA